MPDLVSPPAPPEASGAPAPPPSLPSPFDGPPTPPSAPPSTPPPPPAPPANLVGTDGKFVENWTELLPPEYAHERGMLARYQTPQDLALATINAQRMVGRKGLLVPTENSTPEEVAAYRKAVGAPESPEGYKLKPEEIPQGMVWDENLSKPFLEVAHKWHLPASAMRELIGIHMRTEQARTVASFEQQQAQQKQRYDTGVAELQREWGPDFEKTKARVQALVRAAKGDLNSEVWLQPEAVKTLANILPLVSEDRLVMPDSASANPLARGNYKQIADDIVHNTSNPKHKAYWDGDKQTQDLVTQYYRLAEEEGQLGPRLASR